MQQISRFLILEQRGSGGFEVVYLIEDPVLIAYKTRTNLKKRPISTDMGRLFQFLLVVARRFWKQLTSVKISRNRRKRNTLVALRQTGMPTFSQRFCVRFRFTSSLRGSWFCMSVVYSDTSSSDSEIKELLLSARAGSNSSLGLLLQEYRDSLLLMADEELGSDLKVKESPSDVVQDSFLEVKRDFGQFAGSSPEEFLAWLRRLMLNNLANIVRAYRETEKRDVARERRVPGRSGNDDAMLADADTLTASKVMLKNEQVETLRLAIAGLSQEYQDIIRLRNYERMSFEDLGKHFKRTPEATRKLWVRSIEALHQALEGLNDSVQR